MAYVTSCFSQLWVRFKTDHLGLIYVAPGVPKSLGFIELFIFKVVCWFFFIIINSFEPVQYCARKTEMDVT